MGRWDLGTRTLRAASRIGIQLYTLRSLMEKDVEATLAAVADIGYREVEFAGEFGRTPARLRATLSRLDLSCPSRHVPPEFDDGWDATLEASAALGNRYVTVAWIPVEMRRSLDDWKRTAESFARAGEAARRAGLRFAYHNHDFEFAERAGRVPFDVLLESTDPSLVAIELDLYWISKAGHDPLAYLARGAGTDRYKMVHVKDMDATPARGMVDPGTGVLDFSRLLPAARAAGVEHYFVEHDHPGDPLATARTGYRYLQRLLR